MITLQIPMVRMCDYKFQRWCLNFTTIPRLTSPESYFYWDKFGCIWEKRKLSARNISSTTDTILKIPTVDVCVNKLRTSCSNFTIIQQLMSPGSSFYEDIFECMQEKEGVLGNEE